MPRSKKSGSGTCRRSSRSLQQQGPPEPSPELVPVCPRLALCASLLLPPAEQSSSPFHGTFPDLTIEHSALMGVLTCIAVNVLPAHLLWEHKARYKGLSNAGMLCWWGTVSMMAACIARRGNTLPPAYQEYGQPAFMRRASWYCQGRQVVLQAQVSRCSQVE